jgi:hypothetical protein
MLITISFISVLLLGIIGLIVYNLIYKYHDYADPQWLSITSTICIALASICLVFAVGIIVSNTCEKDIYYQNKLYEKQVLEYRLEQIENGVNTTGNELVYSDIVKFNNSIREVKKWANNPWTSWFNNDLIADNIDYVAIPNLDTGGE